MKKTVIPAVPQTPSILLVLIITPTVLPIPLVLPTVAVDENSKIGKFSRYLDKNKKMGKKSLRALFPFVIVIFVRL